jgi:hypothetical protein
MTDEIDIAARRIVQREPSAAFADDLVARLRDAASMPPPEARLPLWAGRAAMVALVLLGAVAVRVGNHRPLIAPTPAPTSVAVVDLEEFAPLPRLRVARTQVASETDLDGFEPVAKMTLSRWPRE